MLYFTCYGLCAMYCQRKIRNTNSGFTLLEVVISLFIITMMIALFLANYDAGNRTNDISLAAQKMVSDIRVAQNKALGSTIYSGSFPLGGWGVHFDLNAGTYKIFADCNNNEIYDAAPQPPPVCPDESLEQYGGQTFFLPANVIISGLSTPANSNLSSLNITFLPPDPQTRIFDGLGTTTSATITLKQTATGKTSSLTVNGLGLIQAN